MITPAFNLTATERVLPNLALDFTTASLDSRVTFTRTGNTATVTNSSGYVVPINANLPRFDYDPIAFTCKGLLIEESRTNQFTYSEQFNNVIWVKTNSTITPDTIIAPSGTLVGDKMIASVGSSEHNMTQVSAYVSGTSYTFSVYAKAGEYGFICLTYGGAAFGASTRAFFNLTNGTVGTLINTPTATITAVGNGWYRCTMTKTATVTVASNTLINATTADNLLVTTGDGVSGLYLWGAQLEAGAFSTSFIPTVATSVTRNADVAVMTSTNFSSWYTATTGAAVVWAIPQTATGTRPLLQFDDTTANEIIALRGNVANPEMSIVDGGVAQAQIDAGTIVANTAYKLSGGWNTNNCAAAKDGGTVGTDTSATIPTPTQLRIGSDGTNYASGIIQKLFYYKQRLIDAEVQAFSK